MSKEEESIDPKQMMVETMLRRAGYGERAVAWAETITAFLNAGREWKILTEGASLERIAVPSEREEEPGQVFLSFSSVGLEVWEEDVFWLDFRGPIKDCRWEGAAPGQEGADRDDLIIDFKSGKSFVLGRDQGAGGISAAVAIISRGHALFGGENLD